MSFNLRNRSFLKELDFSTAEWRFLLRLAAELKTAKYTGTEAPRLSGKNIALIFEKTSTRTRCAFEVAAHDQGAHVTFLDPGSTQLGHKESIADTARVLGRFYDGLEYRGFAQEQSPDGKLPVPGAAEALPAMARLVQAARAAGVAHIASADDHELTDAEISDRPDYSTTYPPHCLRGTRGAEKVAETW